MNANTGVSAERKVVSGLFGTLKLTQMYGPDHSTTQEALATLATAVHECAGDEGEVTIAVRGTRLLVNEKTMRASECGTLALSFLAEEWAKRGLETLRLSSAVEPSDLGTFSAVFVDVDLTQPLPADRLMAAVGASGCRGVVLERREDDASDPILMEERLESAMRSYPRGLRAFRAVLQLEGVPDRGKQRRARRAVQGLVDNFLQDESAVLALAQIRGHDPRLFHHSLNAAIHAMLIGQRLGMSRRQLGDLGMAALFHDLGKTVPDPAAQPGAKVDAWTRLRAHPGRGARMLLEEGTANEGMLKAAIAAYEHHAHFDRSGFPTLEHEQHLISRIVAIADCYEALTSTRTYRETPYTPHDALSLMQSKAGSIFDPLLLKVFINALGVYPVGSLVELTSGEVAIVIAGPNEGGNAAQPKVRVLRTERGSLAPETIVDLAEGDVTTGTARFVSRTVPSHEVFATVGEHVGAI